MTDKMPDEIWVFPNAASIGDKGFTVTKPEDGYQKYTRADAAAILIAGLESIAANSCCDKCQEAKLVAQSTLDKYRADATKPEAVGVDDMRKVFEEWLTGNGNYPHLAHKSFGGNYLNEEAAMKWDGFKRGYEASRNLLSAPVVSKKEDNSRDKDASAPENIDKHVVPDGYVLVPKEPTDEMIDAARVRKYCMVDTTLQPIGRAIVESVYADMIAALSAPVVPDGYVLVDALTLQKAKCLIRFHVKEDACISIDDNVFYSTDIYGELNRLWIAAVSDKQPKGDE